MTDQLRTSDFIPQGGTWSGLLFNNPGIGLPTRLTWGFDFDFAPVELDDDETSLGVTVEWAQLPTDQTWSAMAGSEFVSETFSGPAEASVYCFMHHRFDRARVSVLEQVGPDIRVRADLTGDLDGLGIPSLSVEAWLRFSGIYVQVHPNPSSLDEAAAALSAWTSLDGLSGVERQNNFLFSPT